MNTPQERANSRDTLSPFVLEHASVRSYTFQPEEARAIFVAPPPRQHASFTGSQER